MAKRNITYIKPQDPEFLRVLKKEAGYDEKNHKFEELEKDFVDDDDTEQPQVVVLNPGDLTAEEADKEKQKIEEEDEKDLSKVCFVPKKKEGADKRKHSSTKENKNQKKAKPVLSFDIDEEDEDS